MLGVEVGDLAVERVVEPLHVGVRELRRSVDQLRIGADGLERDQQVGILATFTVGAVAASAGGGEDVFPLRREAGVDRERVFRRLIY